jgi:hypothetical protein
MSASDNLVLSGLKGLILVGVPRNLLAYLDPQWVRGIGKALSNTLIAGYHKDTKFNLVTLNKLLVQSGSEVLSSVKCISCDYVHDDNDLIMRDPNAYTPPYDLKRCFYRHANPAHGKDKSGRSKYVATVIARHTDKNLNVFNAFKTMHNEDISSKANKENKDPGTKRKYDDL